MSSRLRLWFPTSFHYCYSIRINRHFLTELLYWRHSYFAKTYWCWVKNCKWLPNENSFRPSAPFFGGMLIMVCHNHVSHHLPNCCPHLILVRHLIMEWIKCYEQHNSVANSSCLCNQLLLDSYLTFFVCSVEFPLSLWRNNSIMIERTLSSWHSC